MIRLLLDALAGAAMIVAAFAVVYMFIIKQLTIAEFLVIFWLIILNIQISTLVNRK